MTEDISLRASVHEFDQKAMTLQITLLDGSKVSGPVATQHYDDIMKAFIGYKQGAKILLQGVGKYSRLGRLRSIESIEHVDLLDPQDIPARFEELKAYKDGWLDGDGRAPSPEGLDWLAGLFAADKYPDSLPLPYAYPSVDGGVQLEWPLAPYDVSLEVRFEDKDAVWHFVNLETDEDEEELLNLKDKNKWEWVIRRLAELAGAEQRD